MFLLPLFCHSFGIISSCICLLEAYKKFLDIKETSTLPLPHLPQNAGRIIRGLFEIVLRRGWPVMASRLLTLCRCVDRQLWSFQHPLRQFEKQLTHEVLNKIEARKMELHRLKDMTADEIGKRF